MIRSFHIVYLCGSTCFQKEFLETNFVTIAGRIVELSVGFYPHATNTPDQKTMIDLANEILVLNVGGHIGESSRNEIEYARNQGKAVRYLEPPKVGTERIPIQYPDGQED